ncbi:MAG: TAXI family TRAP transporter solute-binding subunit [Vicinamibacterales bacterium]
MRRICLPLLLAASIAVLAVGPGVNAQSTSTAAKRPIFGASCPTCPWGAMGEAVKDAMKPLGYDVQVCYSCGGPARSVRLVADGSNATPSQNPGPGAPPTPEGKLDFGATGAELLQYAYLGIHDFARDKEGPRKRLRLLANIQMPTYYMVAVDPRSGISGLRQIAEKKLPVKLIARGGLNEGINVAVLEYFGLSEEKIRSFGGTTSSSFVRGSEVDVVIGWASLVNAPEYAVWYDAPQQHDFKYLDLPADLRARLAKAFYVTEHAAPEGLLRGVDRRVNTIVRNGTVVYARADMPDVFAYSVARALDEHKDVLQWSIMPFSYDPRAVWRLGEVPLHPGAARYYRARGYLTRK